MKSPFIRVKKLLANSFFQQFFRVCDSVLYVVCCVLCVCVCNVCVLYVIYVIHVCVSQNEILKTSELDEEMDPTQFDHVEKYLEHLIESGNTQAKYHNQLAFLYLRKVWISLKPHTTRNIQRTTHTHTHTHTPHNTQHTHTT